jgi:hypothetical protein
MWFSNSLEIACACSVFSFAMMVRLLISGLLLTVKSWSASLKSAATSAEGRDMMGKIGICIECQSNVSMLEISRASKQNKMI